MPPTRPPATHAHTPVRARNATVQWVAYPTSNGLEGVDVRAPPIWPFRPRSLCSSAVPHSRSLCSPPIELRSLHSHTCWFRTRTPLLKRLLISLPAYASSRPTASRRGRIQARSPSASRATLQFCARASPAINVVTERRAERHHRSAIHAITESSLTQTQTSRVEPQQQFSTICAPFVVAPGVALGELVEQNIAHL